MYLHIFLKLRPPKSNWISTKFVSNFLCILQVFLKVKTKIFPSMVYTFLFHDMPIHLLIMNFWHQTYFFKMLNLFFLIFLNIIIIRNPDDQTRFDLTRSWIESSRFQNDSTRFDSTRSWIESSWFKTTRLGIDLSWVN